MEWQRARLSQKPIDCGRSKDGNHDLDGTECRYIYRCTHQSRGWV